MSRNISLQIKLFSLEFLFFKRIFIDFLIYSTFVEFLLFK